MLTFNAKNHRYELDGKPVTGVTTILGVLAKPALIQWAADMTAKWIRENCTACDELSGDSGERHYTCHESDLQEAVKAHIKKKEAAGERGTDVHALIEEYIKLCIEHGGNALTAHRNDPMVQKFIDWAMLNNIRFLASEKQVYSRELWFAGTADFTFEKDGKRYVGDLKTMRKMWDRVPFFQTAGYMIALEEMGEEKYDGSCIININKETTELTEHWTYDHENDKQAFRACLTLYRQLSNF